MQLYKGMIWILTLLTVGFTGFQRSLIWLYVLTIAAPFHPSPQTPPPHTAPIHAQLHPSRSVQYDMRISAYLWVYKDIIFLSVFHK